MSEPKQKGNQTGSVDETMDDELKKAKERSDQKKQNEGAVKSELRKQAANKGKELAKKGVNKFKDSLLKSVGERCCNCVCCYYCNLYGYWYYFIYFNNAWIGAR